jgi:DNA-binding MarR family transcriptional regulator
MTGPREVNIRLGLLLRQAHRHASRTLADALAPLALTPRHFGVLLQLARDGVSTQRDLIAHTGSDKAGMTRTVEDLEALGHISRTPSAADRRVSEIRLTARGRAVFDQASALADTAGQALFGQFSDAELATVESVLARLVGGHTDAPT